jgi:hypothetical protein
MARVKNAVFFLIIVILGTSASAADPAPAVDPLLRADLGVEHTRGANNSVTALGNGGLTVGVSAWGELAYLRWPSVSRYEQLRYVAMAYGPFHDRKRKFDVRYGADAPGADWTRYGRPIERYPGLGARGGLSFADGSLAWLGDPSWTSRRGYEPESGPVLCTGLTRTGAEVKVCQWVDRDEDLLVQVFDIDAPAATKFAYTASLAANDRLSTYSGNPDIKGVHSAKSYLADRGIILSSLPDAGYFIALAFDRTPAGRLAGDLGLEQNLDRGKGQVVVLIAAAKSADAAVAMIERARAAGPEALRARVTAAWKPTADRISLPAAASPAEARVARRSILNLFVGRDRDTGAIVASPSRQPAYHFDWPRDGAFFDLTLDLAGFPELATDHLAFYRATQRHEPLAFHPLWLMGGRSPFYSPRGHWDGNLYTNGHKGRMWNISFEIDETALVIWDLWRHEQYVPAADRPQYERDSLPTLTMAADGLVKYVDVKKGWIKKAIEDDADVPRATLHGAAAVLTGLCAAVDAGKKWGADPAKIARWREAAVALRAGMLSRIGDPAFLDQGGWRGVQWSLFPAPLFDGDTDPRMQPLLDRLATEIEEKVDKKRPGFAYLGEQVFILAIAGRNRPEYRPLLQRAVALLSSEVPVPGTDAFGEVTVWIDDPVTHQKISLQRTSVPHLWTGVTAYLAVEALYQPERFLSQVPPPPE